MVGGGSWRDTVAPAAAKSSARKAVPQRPGLATKTHTTVGGEAGEEDDDGWDAGLLLLLWSAGCGADALAATTRLHCAPITWQL